MKCATVDNKRHTYIHLYHGEAKYWGYAHMQKFVVRYRLKKLSCAKIQFQVRVNDFSKVDKLVGSSDPPSLFKPEKDLQNARFIAYLKES